MSRGRKGFGYPLSHFFWDFLHREICTQSGLEVARCAWMAMVNRLAAR
jgi:hypothetical protein